jgi:hypothetical protein
LLFHLQRLCSKNEIEIILKFWVGKDLEEVVMACLEELTLNLYGKTEENHGTPQ